MQIFNTSIIELAVVAALLSLFLDFCFREGNIFEGWLDFWADLHLPIDVKESLDNDREARFELVEWFWFKPLGGCVVCMNVWISFVLWISICLITWSIPFNTGLGWLIDFSCGMLLIVLLSNFIVRFFKEKIV